MQVALAQINVRVGDIRFNLTHMKKIIEECNSKKYDVVAFPELCISGYLIGDLWYDPDWIEELTKANNELQSFIIENQIQTIVIYGNISTCPGKRNQDGRRALYNSAWMLQYDGLGNCYVACVAKTLLPNYRFFDDKRYFSPNEEKNGVVKCITPYSKEIVKLGLEVCEDIWHDDYPVNPTEKLVLDENAEYIFNISASPYSYGKSASRNRVIQKTLRDVHTHYFKYFFYVNNVGAQNNGKNILTFDGDSSVYSGTGERVVFCCIPFQEDMLVFDTLGRYKEVLERDISKEEYQYLASLVGIQHMYDIQKSPVNFVIGVSGGIDSAVVLCLIERALGKNCITAINMPSQYNSEATKSIAAHICDELHIPLHTIPIGSLVDGQVKALSEAGFCPSQFNEENIQAKIRGTSLLSNIAGITGAVMTNNGNKLEVALGYATLYGDINGAIAPLGDLLKVEVWALARYLNEEIYQREVIPNAIIANRDYEVELQPSAELKEAQKDPMKWGYHDALLAYLMNYRRGSLKKIIRLYDVDKQELFALLASYIGCTNAAMKSIFLRYNLFDRSVFIEDLEWFMNCMNRAVFKRIQSPPIIIQSKSAFGYDHRESQVYRNWDL